MAVVETVRGPVEVERLGETLMHEHVFVLDPQHVQDYGEGAWWDEEFRVADAIAKLRKLVARGVSTIVDPTVWGIGRYIPRVQRVAAEVPELNIIVATGLYSFADVPFAYANQGPGTLLDIPEPMVEDFAKDITDGIAGTGVKAAFLKCAIDGHGLMPGVERILRAVALTHVRTGVPITVHTDPHTQTGLAVLDVFTEEGVDLTKVVLGHSGDSNDLDHLMRLADSGATLGMDRFGLEFYNPTGSRVDTVVRLCERGYADRMVLSHDYACFMDTVGEHWDEALPQVAPQWHYGHIHDDILPALREKGVTDAQIHQMLVENPRRHFS
ncbi:phosphotriesterase [Sphaerisporangium krabiense]|uniref:Phosphotriesterase-related protein n=1 Tax=Sphaerisporangium krabiense TaxID=763782 RepID=A0A7W8Z6H0_9ACTN|nr:phosphotriesterase [Sphaerisporangium krabiense]MBB5628286.1 phosphotriesterase-related protein [Sphaerisporangium krabiense]GII66282.1 phosphotriesterase [Sphaerisporangium krabiense]